MTVFSYTKIKGLVSPGMSSEVSWWGRFWPGGVPHMWRLREQEGWHVSVSPPWRIWPHGCQDGGYVSSCWQNKVFEYDAVFVEHVCPPAARLPWHNSHRIAASAGDCYAYRRHVSSSSVRSQQEVEDAWNAGKLQDLCVSDSMTRISVSLSGNQSGSKVFSSSLVDREILCVSVDLQFGGKWGLCIIWSHTRQSLFLVKVHSLRYQWLE